jgi:hypothetical protein
MSDDSRKEIEERTDPEASYRRGYQQGAFAALVAVNRLTIDKLNHWVGVTLWKWRYEDRVKNRSVPPPPPN